MYSNDFVAYVSETYRRMDEAKEAEQSRLSAECVKAKRNYSNASSYLSGLLLALVVFFTKRWS